MTTRSFSLAPGAPETVTVTWEGHFQKARVVHEGREVGSFADKAALQKGAAFTLADGSTLDVRLDEGFMGRRLVLARNGSPLPGSDTDPARHRKQAAHAAFVVAALNCVGGIVALLIHSPLLDRLGLGIESIAAGLIYAVLGFFIFRGSVIAAGATLGLYVLDAMATIVLGSSAGVPPNLMGILVRILFIGFFWRGFKAARTLRTTSRSLPASTP